MYEYILFKELLYLHDVGYYETYGIKVLDENKAEIFAISDVHIDKKKIAELCLNLNSYKLSPLHIYDVIDDFIS